MINHPPRVYGPHRHNHRQQFKWEELGRRLQRETTDAAYETPGGRNFMMRAVTAVAIGVIVMGLLGQVRDTSFGR
jgi:hypothetical protein